MKKLALCILPLAAFFSTSALAATATGSLLVKATVAKSCSVNTPASGAASNAVLDFGTVNSLSAPINSDTTTANGGTNVSVICSNTTGWSLAFDAGKNANAGQRRMAGGSSEYISYNLFSDSARATSIPVGSTAFSGTGNGNVQSSTVYGTIPAGQTLPTAGSYLDTVTVTVTY